MDSTAGSDASTPTNHTVSSKKRRGRPPKGSYAAYGSSDDDDEEYSGRTRRRNRNTRPRVSAPSSSSTVVPKDLYSHRATLEDDELNFGVVDPEGEKKVNELGYLNGGREYRCRTFTCLGRGNRLYMLSTEPARAMGYRDSYLLFLKHRSLHKIIVDDSEKWDLIERNIIPHSYKGRAVGIVAARSIFREFGARIIVGGRRIVDDYWEGEFRARGFVEGELADPDDKLPPPGMPYNRNQYVAWHGASAVYHPQPSLEAQLPAAARKRKKEPPKDATWLFQHAKATAAYNNDITKYLVQKQDIGYFEPHTNLLHVPLNTQPTKTHWIQAKTGTECPAPKLDILVALNSDVAPQVSIANIPPSVYASCPLHVQEAIRKRQEQEIRSIRLNSMY
ncbi:RSC complex subunit Rsc7 [Schizosaccharomyces pombe]|uniref:Chromatin structure-remodeling complex subunit rsc7 n=1 Tax=Schizosaccharomyces pombe (strain 972 / ATCC 24843) TaxID=284812 RepID=RSC7_SCHPO|nr:RSC complex subunit Rsc7 [Schizosaccharomyces pombe]O94522.1 RecName: Full=Chromatin structure-remodeling complex subunit rsc7; AltName: Full=Remodel the structure of chromatin complex subunit 7 [Schizosaccharomyces pombe 972h-]CAA22826.1 RSC complex subunit Rsc7 [Schizosaccharomyces pombe]|eukprot:NP_588169.1 RSC complex subunit Rsc7 [Schizosaccharomyces pombe]